MVDRGVRKRFRAGDPEAVRRVYRAYGRLVYAVAYRVLGDRALAEEATQQTFVKAWRAAASLDDEPRDGPVAGDDRTAGCDRRLPQRDASQRGPARVRRAG